jgi:hypothetical protein
LSINYQMGYAGLFQEKMLYTGNPYVRFDEGTEAVRPPPTLQDGARVRERWTSSRFGLIQLLALQFPSCQR